MLLFPDLIKFLCKPICFANSSDIAFPTLFPESTKAGTRCLPILVAKNFGNFVELFENFDAAITVPSTEAMKVSVLRCVQQGLPQSFGSGPWLKTISFHPAIFFESRNPRV